jgi:hypothetical protein
LQNFFANRRSSRRVRQDMDAIAQRKKKVGGTIVVVGD